MAQVDRISTEHVTYVVDEVTPGAHPGSGDVRARVNLDVNLASGIARETLPNNRDSAYRHDNAPHVLGKATPKLPALTWNVCGIPSAQRLDASVTPSVLSHDVLFRHGFGRRYAAQGCTVGSGSTTTSIVVDDSTGRIAGELVTFVLSGVRYVRRITEVVDGTTFTVAPALPGSPSNGDVVTACRTFVLAEQRSATLAISHKRGGPTGEEYRLLGCFGSLKLNFPGHGQIITASLEGGAISSVGPVANGGLSAPSFGSTDPADDDMDGPLVFFSRLYIDGTETRYEPGSLKVELMQRPEEVPDGSTDSGIGGWLDTGGRDNGVAVTIEFTTRVDQARPAVFDAGTVQHLAFMVDPGNDTGLALEVARAQLIERPVPVQLGQAREGMTHKYKALLDTLPTLAGSPPNAEARDLGRAPIRLGLW